MTHSKGGRGRGGGDSCLTLECAEIERVCRRFFSERDNEETEIDSRLGRVVSRKTSPKEKEFCFEVEISSAWNQGCPWLGRTGTLEFDQLAEEPQSRGSRYFTTFLTSWSMRS